MMPHQQLQQKQRSGGYSSGRKYDSAHLYSIDSNTIMNSSPPPTSSPNKQNQYINNDIPLTATSGVFTSNNATNMKIIKNMKKKDWKRMVIWGTTTGIVILQLIVVNIIYLHPSEKYHSNIESIEKYSMIDVLPSTRKSSGTTRTSIKTKLSSSQSNQQQRRIAVVGDVPKNRVKPTSIVPGRRTPTLSNYQQQKRPLRAQNGRIKVTKVKELFEEEVFVRKNPFNFQSEHDKNETSEVLDAVQPQFTNFTDIYKNQTNDVDTSANVDTVLYPILNAGIMYSICRGDRSGSVIADMIYAHAFAYRYNITYGGNCCVTRGLPKIDTKNLIKDLHWQTILPFRCPKGVNNKKYNVLRPNATSIHPLILNPDVYRLQGHQSNFKLPWKQSVSDALYRYNDHRQNRPYIIAVHVRRGDVTPCTYKRRYLPNSHYLSLIDQYTPNATSLNGRSLQVMIYTESDSFESFDIFEQRNYTLMMDTSNLAHVWKALSTADVAILSRSYFSIVPAILNPNIVVATDFFEFDVRVIPNWEYANISLVKSSEEQIRQMFINDCNNTKQFASGSSSTSKQQ